MTKRTECTRQLQGEALWHARQESEAIGGGEPPVGAKRGRMDDCLTTSSGGAMTQWVRVPIRATNSGGHSDGRAT